MTKTIDQIRKSINLKKNLGLGLILVSAGIWGVSTIGNNKFLPFTQICFKPDRESIKEERNLKLLKCDSNERVAIMLTPMYDFYKESDVEFESKIAKNGTLKKLSNNLSQTQLLTGVAAIVAGLGTLVTSLAINEQEDTKYKLYQDDRVNVFTSKLISDDKLKLVNEDINPVPPLSHDERELFARQHSLEISAIDAQIAENSKRECEALKDADKARKAYAKIFGANNDEGDSVDNKTQSPKLELDNNYDWYYKVLNEPFKTITGVSGSGKSTFEHVLIRLAKDDGQHCLVMYPNTTRTASEGSTVLNEVEDINNYLAGFTKLVNDRKAEAKANNIDEDDYLDFISDRKGLNGRVAIFCMEANNFELNGVDPDLLASFYRLAMTDCRKWGLTTSIAGQSMNQTSTCSKLKGFSDLLKSQTRIDCQATTDSITRKSVSLGKAKVKFSDAEESEDLELYFYKPKDKSKY